MREVQKTETESEVHRESMGEVIFESLGNGVAAGQGVKLSFYIDAEQSEWESGSPELGLLLLMLLV